jgi:hypothetical protein
MRELTLFWSQPRGCQRCVREEKEAEKSYEACNRAFTTIGVSDYTGFKLLDTNTMNSHLQPAMPRSPSIPAKTPAAIKPEKPVARICAQYSNAIRVATSEPHR